MKKANKNYVLFFIYSLVSVFSFILLSQLWTFFIDSGNNSKIYEAIVPATITFLLLVLIKSTALIIIQLKKSNMSTRLNIYKTMSVIDVTLFGATFLLILFCDIIFVLYGQDIINVMLTTLLTLFGAVLLCAPDLSLYIVNKHSAKSQQCEAEIFSNKKLNSRKNMSITIISFSLSIFLSVLLQLFTVALIISGMHPSNLILVISVGALKMILFFVITVLNLLSEKKILLLSIIDLIIALPFVVFTTITLHNFEISIAIYLVCSLIGAAIGYIISLIKKHKLRVLD